MTAKQYLQQAFYLNQQIETDQRELEKLRALAETVPSIKQTEERVQTGGPVDRVSEIVAKIVDLEAEIQGEIDSYVTMQMTIRKIISRVKNKKWKVILKRRYIHFEKWEQIAEKTHQDLRWVFRLHGKALQEIEKINFDH